MPVGVLDLGVCPLLEGAVRVVQHEAFLPPLREFRLELSVKGRVFFIEGDLVTTFLKA